MHGTVTPVRPSTTVRGGTAPVRSNIAPARSGIAPVRSGRFGTAIDAYNLGRPQYPGGNLSQYLRPAAPVRPPSGLSSPVRPPSGIPGAVSPLIRSIIPPVASAGGGLPAPSAGGGLGLGLSGIGSSISSYGGNLLNQVKTLVPLALKIIAAVIIVKIILWLVKGRRR